MARLGSAAANVTLNVASMTTSTTGFSWNHSKPVVVDGTSVLTGGIDSWKDDYLDTAHPVNDVDLAPPTDGDVPALAVGTSSRSRTSVT